MISGPNIRGNCPAPEKPLERPPFPTLSLPDEQWGPELPPGRPCGSRSDDFVVGWKTATPPGSVSWSSAPQYAAVQPQPGSHADQQLKGVRAVVVDDDLDSIALIGLILQRSAALVWSTTSSEAALAMVNAARPNVLVCDIRMPQMDGFELVERVRRLGDAVVAALPVIAVTGHSRAELWDRILEAHFHACLRKPIIAAELIAAIRKLSLSR